MSQQSLHFNVPMSCQQRTCYPSAARPDGLMLLLPILRRGIQLIDAPVRSFKFIQFVIGNDLIYLCKGLHTAYHSSFVNCRARDLIWGRGCLSSPASLSIHISPGVTGPKELAKEQFFTAILWVAYMKEFFAIDRYKSLHGTPFRWLGSRFSGAAMPTYIHAYPLFDHWTYRACKARKAPVFALHSSISRYPGRCNFAVGLRQSAWFCIRSCYR